MARKKKAAKKVVKKKAARRPAAKKPSRKKRAKPETLRLRRAQAGFTVNDLQRSLAFYCDIVGFTPVGEPWKDGDRVLGAEIKAGNVTMWLGQDDWKKGRDRVKGEGVRLYLTTVQDIDELAARIKSRGGRLSHEPETQPWGTRDFGIVDPDGYKITIQRMR